MTVDFCTFFVSVLSAGLVCLVLGSKPKGLAHTGQALLTELGPQHRLESSVVTVLHCHRSWEYSLLYLLTTLQFPAKMRT